MAGELRLLDDAHDLLELALVQAELEEALGGVDDDLAHLALAVEAVELAVARRGEVQRHLERPDDPVVAIGQAVLEMVERREVEDVVAVPRSALDADRVVDSAQLLELARADDDGVLRDERHV